MHSTAKHVNAEEIFCLTGFGISERRSDARKSCMALAKYSAIAGKSALTLAANAIGRQSERGTRDVSAEKPLRYAKTSILTAQRLRKCETGCRETGNCRQCGE
jgi:hypothetical protein